MLLQDDKKEGIRINLECLSTITCVPEMKDIDNFQKKYKF